MSATLRDVLADGFGSTEVEVDAAVLFFVLYADRRRVSNGPAAVLASAVCTVVKGAETDEGEVARVVDAFAALGVEVRS